MYEATNVELSGAVVSRVRLPILLEGIIDQLKHEITDCHGFEYAYTAWNCLELFKDDYYELQISQIYL